MGASEQSAQRPRLAALAALASASEPPTPSTVLAESELPPDHGPCLVAKVTDQSGANASERDVRSTLEAHAMRMGIGSLCCIRVETTAGRDDGIAYITCSPTQADTLMSRAQRGGVDLLHRRKKRPPLRLRIVEVDDCGALLFETAHQPPS